MSLHPEALAEDRAPGGPAPIHAVIDPPPLCRLGDYELLEEIGRGGMGVVYRARQVSLKRIVAVKVLPAAQFADAATRERFQSEARLAASLRHPHIVAIFETGEDQRCPYFAMEYVEGWTLDELVHRQPLSPREAACCVERVALAIEHAHRRGILHRDLKPSNVLMDETNQPLVTDFGLARPFEGTAYPTVTGAMLGSPNYMPPEQSLGRRGEPDPRSDIYSLGAILYYLLTGRPPFLGGNLAETLHHLAHSDPVPPRLLNSSAPRDLETICLKCLEKEPSKRYGTAQSLAEDLNRFLHDEPIHARPVGHVQKAWRWCRRKPALAALWAATFLLLVTTFTGVSLAGLRSSAVRKAEQREYFAGITLADHYVRIGDIQRALDVLTNCPPRHRHWEWGRLMYLCHQEIETIATVTNQNLQIIGGLDYTRLIVNRDRSRLVTVGEDGAATVWNLKRGVKMFTAGGPTNRIKDMAFAPDGQALALLGRGGAVEVWNANGGRKLFTLTATNTPVQSLNFSHDGTKLRVTAPHSATIWDAASGQHVRATPPLPGKFIRLALAPDGTRLVTLDATNRVRCWNAETGQSELMLDSKFSSQTRLFFSPNGRRLLVGSLSDGPSTVWDTVTGEQLCSLPTRLDTAAFSADGSRVATTSGDNVPRVWSSGSGREILALKGHDAIVRFLDFSPDSLRVTTASEDASVKTWRAGLGREYIKSSVLNEGLVFSPDGTRLALSRDDSTDGFGANGGLIEGSDGMLYGTTQLGGSSNAICWAGCGTAFRLNKDGTAYETLHHFTGSPEGGNGAIPAAGLIEGSDGALYGTTAFGGAEDPIQDRGTVFKLNRDGSGYSVLHRFVLSAGGNPFAPLVEGSDGALYGNTQFGGSAGGGSVFKLNKDGSSYSVLHTFGTNELDGRWPDMGLIEGSDGALYGTTSYGGSAGGSTVFKLDKDGSGFAVVYSYSYTWIVCDDFGVRCSFGSVGLGRLLEGEDGSLYGATRDSGSGRCPDGCGTVFRLNRDGSGHSRLITFTGASDFVDGAAPLATLVEGSDGTLYGTTAYGGSENAGTVFMLNKDGSGYAMLHSFTTNDLDGRYPRTALVEAGDGAFYGTTPAGGIDGAGTVYKLNKEDGSSYEVLHSFGANGTDGRLPNGLVVGSDGALYGTTSRGGPDDVGTVFRLESDGSSYEILYNFGANGLDGRYPAAALIVGNDNALYGTTSVGGNPGYGSVFKLNQDGSGYEVLHSFAGPDDGAFPSAALVEGSDGALYGVTEYAVQLEEGGTLFKLNKDGSSYSVLHRFGAFCGPFGCDGVHPVVWSKAAMARCMA